MWLAIRSYYQLDNNCSGGWGDCLVGGLLCVAVIGGCGAVVRWWSQGDADGAVGRRVAVVVVTSMVVAAAQNLGAPGLWRA